MKNTIRGLDLAGEGHTPTCTARKQIFESCIQRGVFRGVHSAKIQKEGYRAPNMARTIKEAAS